MLNLENFNRLDEVQNFDLENFDWIDNISPKFNLTLSDIKFTIYYKFSYSFC